MASSPSSDDPPLSIEPIVGWRVWRLRRHEGVLMLASVTMSDVWPPGEVMGAECQRDLHATVPDEECTCGIYAAASPELLAHAGVFNASTSVVGAVAMWGRVVEHTSGARSRFAYPARLRLSCAPCLVAGEGAVDAVGLRETDGVLTALCFRHRWRVRGAWRRADLVQEELLETYGVELMPIERVASSMRTAPASPTSGLPRPLVTAVYAIGAVVRILLTGLFMAWAFSGFVLLALAIVIGILQSIAQGLGLWHPPEPPPVVIAEAPPVSVIVVPPIDDLPYRGAPAPPPVPLPRFAFVCGVGQGDHVDIVRCSEPSDLIGIAALATPKGPRHDCFGPWDAYSSRHRYWICWTIDGQAWVRPRPRAPTPGRSPSGKEVSSMNIGEPKHVREIEPIAVPVPETIPAPEEEPVTMPEEAPTEEPSWVPDEEPVGS